MSKYIYERASYGSTSRTFDAGAYVPDLASAMTRESGEAWTFNRTQCEETWQGKWHNCHVIRARDGLCIWINRGPYNHPTRGVARIDLKGSNACHWVSPGQLKEVTFAHDRDVNATARHILRNLVTPSEALVAEKRQKLRSETATKEAVLMRLEGLAAMPGVSVVQGHNHDEKIVTIGPFTFRVSYWGHITVERYTSCNLSDLADLAEHFESIRRQLAA